jgi:phage repressor protein C with HTH and peptisase S24 domain/DNA-binding XRE family transcriptional regulator
MNMINDDTIKKTICRNITKYRKLAGLNQKEFAAKLGAAPSRVSSWETGANSTDIDTLFKICEILNVSINDMCEIYPDANIMLSYLEQELINKYRSLDPYGKETVSYILDRECERVSSLQKQKERISENTPQRIIAYYQRLASAGSGDYLFDDIPTDFIRVRSTAISRQADFVIGVNGRSMEDTYHDGDRVFVKKLTEIDIGDIGVFTRGNDCFIKELGTDRLISHNQDKDAYPDIPASDDIRLVGKVLGIVDD